LVVLTGGDPAKRPDLVELVRHATSTGLQLGLTPSATPLVSERLISNLADAGLRRLAISIDGPDSATHDSFRGVQGGFGHALRILGAAWDHGIRTHINTTVHSGSIERLREIADLVAELGSVLWNVFYVVPTGRAEARMLPSADAVEASLNELANIAAAAPFAVKTTAAPHYRRVLLQRKNEHGHGTFAEQAGRVNDGRGFLFVSHRGEISPSGVLPGSCGDVRRENPITVYRNHPTFRVLRDADTLYGKCGACKYRNVCGGSRARAYALTGNMLESDALCAYVPPGYESDRPIQRRLEVLS
jgi:radical SAM protein with 4Fe4S-binding SPASM domain